MAAGHLQKSTWLLQKSIGIIVAYQQLAAGQRPFSFTPKENPSQAICKSLRDFYKKSIALAAGSFSFGRELRRVQRPLHIKTPHQL